MNEQAIREKYEKSEFLTLRDLCDLLDIKPVLARTMCAEKIIHATRSEFNGNWLVYTQPFLNHPNWNTFIQKKWEEYQQSIQPTNLPPLFTSVDAEYHIDKEEELLLNAFRDLNLSPTQIITLLIEKFSTQSNSFDYSEWIHVLKETQTHMRNHQSST